MRAILAIGLVAGFVASAAADKGRADKLFDEGRRYLATKEYALACTAFEQSQAADPAIGTQLNIALCYEEWGHIASAYRAYIEAERIATAKKDDRSRVAHKKVEELAPKIPHLIVDVPADADASAVFLLDGKEIDRAAFNDDLLLDAGPHSIEARVPGKPPAITKVELHNGDHKRLKIDMPKVYVPPPPPPPPPPPRDPFKLYGGIGLTSAGGVALVIATTVALNARSDYNTAAKACPNGLCESRAAYDATQTARDRANAMTYVSLAGAAAAGVGVYLLWTSRPARPEPHRVTAAPVIAPGEIGVAIAGAL